MPVTAARISARDGAQWLQLPESTGTAAFSGSQGVVQMKLVLSASGLRERTIPYEEQLMIALRSAKTTEVSVGQLHVSLTVQASTSFAVWGNVASGDRCERLYHHALDRPVTVGEVERVGFTACDVDNIPVEHQLPSRTDERSFSARLNASYGTEQSVPSIDYSGGGQYEVLLDVPRHGDFAVELKLGGMPAAQLTGVAECSSERVPLPGGVCGCRAGFTEQRGRCSPCAAGHYKAFS
eukprot:598893-Prymnesium_polylepis.1